MRKRVVVASGVAAFVMAVALWAPALWPRAARPGPPCRGGSPKGVLPHGRRGREGVGSRDRAKEGGSTRRSTIPPRRVSQSTQDTLGASGPARVLRHRHLHAAAASAGTRQAVVHGGRGDRRVPDQVDTDASADPAVVHYDWKEFGMEAWQSPVRPNMRTALVTIRRTGRLPALTPDAQKRRAEAGGAGQEDETIRPASQIFRNLYTRCILGLGALPLVRGGQPGSTEATSAGVSTEIQIFQTPNHVIIVHQSNTDVRIIPLAGRPHLPQTVRQWNGDSRGRWEGNTLVVETTNLNHTRRDELPGRH